MCFFKQVSGIPCPSCGNTRAIILLSEGKLYESLLLNPLGIAVAGIMTIFPIWVVMDLILQKASFYHFYKKSELIIKKRGVALFLIILALLNWIWNTTKHL